MLDVIAHPDFAKNGWIYLAYSEAGEVTGTSMTVIVRGRIRDGRWVDQETLFRAETAVLFGRQLALRQPVSFRCAEPPLFHPIGDRGAASDAQDLAQSAR